MPTVSTTIFVVRYCRRIPEKVIRDRYDEETISFLQKIKWWDSPIEWLIENWELLCDIDKLKEYYKYMNIDD